ncbi:MAG: homoserine dehydrogenase [Alphaproteobacteria bacterium]|nr:homoserine dehydrogenase [Alphaproteobacteria bacterium]
MTAAQGKSAQGKDALRIGIAGLGNVGASVFRLLEEHGDLLQARTGRALRVTAVSARNKGKNRDIDISGVTWHDDPVAVANDPEVDLVVELMGGAEGAAFDLVSAALALGKPVVTANKALLASRGAEVVALLKKSEGGTISFEAAVAGGIPVIKGLREGLAANGIKAVYGILNGTCNYILSEMSETGRAFEDVLKEAQDLGYAEADPTFDVDGIDAAHKLSILSGLSFGCLPDVAHIDMKGIRSITPLDISFARELGFCIKLLGISRLTEKGVEQSVEPCLVPKDSAIASVGGALNAVYIDGDYVGKVLLTGFGAGGNPTASAVVADIVDVARGRALPLMGIANENVAPLQPANILERIGSYYFRLMVLDQPGVIADISAILRDHNVSLESVLQRGRDPDQPVPVILTTHETTEQGVQNVAAEIGRLKAVVEPPYVMRIEEFKD